MKKLTHQQRLERAHIQLLKSKPFALLSGIMMLGTSKIMHEGMPTAATNGRDKYYGAAFMDTLSEKEFAYIVAHENFHVMYKHLTTWRVLYKQHAMAANIACDHVINLQITALDPNGTVVQRPDMALYDEKYKGWDTKQVFEDVMKDAKEQGGKGGPGDGEGDGAMDEHMWEEAEEMTKEEKETLAKEVDRAIRQGDIYAGKMGGNSARDIGALPEPKVDWREQLRDFVSNVCGGRDMSTWRRPNRRYMCRGMYMPTMYSESIGPIVIGIDTSGSIGEKDINRFLAEIKSITETNPPEKIHLLYWDTKVAGEETYEPHDYDQLVQSTKPAGGGGTDPTCVKEYVQNMGTQPELVLMLSDGCIFGGWPDFNCPTMWAMTTDRTAEIGTTIRLED